MSVDFVQQVSCCRQLTPGPDLRESPIVGVLLTDAELDHVGGLLELRQTAQITVASVDGVLELVRRVLPSASALEAYCNVGWFTLPEGVAVQLEGGLTVTAQPVGSKRPRYARTPVCGEQRTTCVVALRLQDVLSHADVLYAPTLPAWSDEFAVWAADANAVFIDGTFWQDDEIAETRFKASEQLNGRSMGHLPMTGVGGSLERMWQLKAEVKAYVHLNNTNPVWDPITAASCELERRGVIIALEGMAWEF